MTKYTSQVFQEEKFWYKKCFANNRNDSRINKIRSVGVRKGENISRQILLRNSLIFYVICQKSLNEQYQPGWKINQN